MRRANSAAPFVPASAPAAKCEWCGQAGDDPLQALVSVCKGCGRASSSRTIRAVSAAPTRRYPAFNHPDSLPPPSGFDDIDMTTEPEPELGPTKNGALPPALPGAKAGPPPLPVSAPKSAPRPAAGRPPVVMPVAAVLPPLPKAPAPKISLVSRTEADSALTIPVPPRAVPRPTPSKAPKAMSPGPLSIIPLGPNSIIPKASPVLIEGLDMGSFGIEDANAAPSYRLPSVSISPIISIPPPPVMMPALGSLPRISISPATHDDAYGPEPELLAANDVPLVAPPPLPTFLGLPVEPPLHMVSAATAKSTAKSGLAVLAAPLPVVSGPLAAAKPPSLKSQLEATQSTANAQPATGTRMLPFILGGIAVGALVAAGIVARTHVAKPSPAKIAAAVATTAAPTAAAAPLATAAVIERPSAPRVALPATAPAPTGRPAPEPTALAAPAPTAEPTKASPEPAAATPSGSFASAGSLEDARAARAAGDLAKASAIYNRLAGNSDTQLDALMGLGDMDRASGDITGAKSAYIRALSSAPGYLPAALGAADAAWDLGSIEEARARYHRIMERYPVRMLPPRVKDRSAVGDK